ncbi:MAG: leucyl aminopeptidase [Rickettsiaceae bacterium]|nr:MAG: leucyl aminopeptidase [Rickettsiaceae bacterium]
MLAINFFDNKDFINENIIILVDQTLTLEDKVNSIDLEYDNIISKTIKKSGFTAKFGEAKVVTYFDKEGAIKQILIVGIGDQKILKNFGFEQLGGIIISSMQANKIEEAKIFTHNTSNDIDQNAIAALIGNGALLSSFRFNKYFSKQDNNFENTVLKIACTDLNATEMLFKQKQDIALGIFLARKCISEPANILYPESYAQIIIDELEPCGVDVEVLGEREMRDLGMGALLGVGQGSEKESKLVIMKYINNKDHPIVGLVGKGVTFDTGGISLKPSSNMADMKYDMAGSAAVVGTIKSLAMRKAQANVIGIIGLVENMPSGTAQRPGDVVKTMSGQTVEILDTDAEGRLVLADAIWYAQDKFNLDCVIDLATLTGAIVVALGQTYAGLFANDDMLAEKLITAGKEVDEKLWRMPLHEDYNAMIKSDIADVANLGNARGAAGSATAAHFIGRFIKNDMKWAHLDIAGMAWEKKGTAICPKGATGYGVRLLNQFIADNYESK